jgi:hypothetical protein
LRPLEKKQRAELSEQRENDQKEAARKLRRRAIVAGGAAAAAVILLAMFVMMWRAANVQRAAAEEQAQIAESRRLAAESSSALIRYPQRSLLLAVEAAKAGESVHRVGVAAGEQSLREALAFVGGQPLVISQSGPYGTSAVGISPDNHWLVTSSDDKAVRVGDLTAFF